MPAEASQLNSSKARCDRQHAHGHTGDGPVARGVALFEDAMPDSRTSSPSTCGRQQGTGPDTLQNFSIAQFVYGVESSQVRGPLVDRRNQQNGVTLSPLESPRFSPVLPESHTLISASATQCGLTVGLCPGARVRHFCLSGKGKAPRDGQAAPRPVSAGCQT